jgi:hypothetical protein
VDGGVMLGVALLLTAPAQAPAQLSWRRIATDHDRARLRNWRRAWVEALAAAGERLPREPELFDPDRALIGAMPPAGMYRCRTVKLGSRSGALPVVAYPSFTCRIGADGSFAKLGGSQRQVGQLYADTPARAVFLGTLVLGVERREMRYGRDRARDLAARVERIGERRWRMAFPYPAFESLLDVVELTPA